MWQKEETVKVQFWFQKITLKGTYLFSGHSKMPKYLVRHIKLLLKMKTNLA